MYQSCGISIDAEGLKGSKKNDLKNNLYCKYCYENGILKNPKMI